MKLAERQQRKLKLKCVLWYLMKLAEMMKGKKNIKSHSWEWKEVIIFSRGINKLAIKHYEQMYANKFNTLV